ncbi:MAG: ribonuclease III [Candidatus Kerfeldbacteria bacterium]|nr:ribonuclease III [Candidatus Kerfeldbacteria bacterium]
MNDQSALASRLGVTFRDPNLLQQALVHRSYLNENRNFSLGNNERLEFLGDAVLELVVTEFLYLNYPNPEGELTNWRAALVNAKMLSDIAETFSIYEHLYLSRGEAKDSNGKARGYILANAFEAIIGAIYLDQGWDAAKKFITDHVLSRLTAILDNKLHIDPKSRFQEVSQERLGVTPSYRVIEESGPDHAKKFIVGVYTGTELVAQGEGTSKQEAQVAAAEKALQAKGW